MMEVRTGRDSKPRPTPKRALARARVSQRAFVGTGSATPDGEGAKVKREAGEGSLRGVVCWIRVRAMLVKQEVVPVGPVARRERTIARRL